MSISKKRQTTDRTYTMGEEKHQLKVSSTERDLGVVLDDKLTFENHLQSKINKANSIMGIIRRTYTYLDNDSFLLLYKALVRPHVEYANQIWSPYLKKHIISIENVQRRATKQIAGMRDLTYEERLHKLKLPTLAYRRLRGDMIETYKILSEKYDKEASDGLFETARTSTRGHSLKLAKKHCNTNIRKFSFTFRVIDTWNSLPEYVVTSTSVKSFEAQLDKHWTNHPLKYNYNN